MFAGVALLVGGFLIFNTFAVTVAQRSKEFALLRTLGASRAQVLRSVLAETLAIGIGRVDPRHHRRAAARPRAAGADVGLRAQARHHEPRSWSRARSSPASPSGSSRRSCPASCRPAARRACSRWRPCATPSCRPACTCASAASSSPCSSRSSASCCSSTACSATCRRRPRVASMLGVGAVVMMFGLALIAPLLVRPLSSVIGKPLERLQGLTGQLARENAQRQPQRTAVTASALMIGLGLVVFVTIFAAGLRATINQGIDDQVRAAGIITHEDGFSPLPDGVVRDAVGRQRRRRRVADPVRDRQAQERRQERPRDRRRSGDRGRGAAARVEPGLGADARRARRPRRRRQRDVREEPRPRGRRQPHADHPARQRDRLQAWPARTTSRSAWSAT